MAEPLTFKFVFADESEGGSPGAAPPDAAPGAAARTISGSAHDTAPAPRPAATPKTPSPAAPSSAPADKGDEAETPRSPRKPPKESVPKAEKTEKPPESGEAKRAFTDLARYLSVLPAIGGGIAGLAHVVEPLLQARERINALNERRRLADEREAKTSAGKAESRPPKKTPAPRPPEAETPAPPETPAPRPPEASPAASPADAGPEPRPPEDEPDERSPAGTVKNPTPGTAAAALEKLITALGPLPEGQKELTATLKPLTALGYTLKELVAAVRAMRAAEKAASRPTPASSPAPRPAPSSPAPSPGGPSPRPPKPGAADITPRDVRPAADSLPVPAPGAASAAADAGIADAAAGGAVAASAAGGPAGLIAGIAIVATIGAASRAFGVLTNTVKKVDRTFVELSGRLAPFNGQLAFAQARAQTQQTLLDIERAGRLGGSLATFTDERARISREFQRVATEFQSVILPVVNAAAGKIADTVEDSRRTVGAALDFLGGLMKGMSISEATTAAATKAMQKQLGESEADRRAKEAMDVAGIFFGDGDKELSIGGVDYGSTEDWAGYIPQPPVRQNRNGPTFGGI